MREKQTDKNSYGLFRTLSTAIVLSCLVAIAALIYLLTQAAPNGDGRVPFILSYAIPFGLSGVIFAAIGIVSMNDLGNKIKRNILLVDSLLCFAMEASLGIIDIVMFNNLAIGISVIGLGICVLVIGIISFLSRKEVQ
ncbi:MAG: hypothetical protein II721_01190 [Bacilli bacterium]|nr:hypothetical protein [Bacilli bacterium]